MGHIWLPISGLQ